MNEALSLDYITKELADFFIVEYPKVPLFYLLPKIHKPGFPPKGRLIVAAQYFLLSNISIYVDFLLQPHVRKIRTYLKDRQDFIQKIEHKSIPSNVMLVSMDVTSLYTSIPHEDIRSTVHSNLDQDPHLQPPVHFILDLVDLLLEKNYFCFDHDFYFQIKGVAMGSTFAPSMSNLFMATLEERFIFNKNENPYFDHIFMIFRYVNNCFLVYMNKELFKYFVAWLNNLSLTISFTFETSD